MNVARANHSATLLSDGSVLVAGGSNDAGLPLSSAELYHPASGTWSNTGSMATARSAYTMTLLDDGRVLSAGGFTVGTAEVTAEIYDPTTGTWSAAAPMITARGRHAAELLRDGRVLVSGGLECRFAGGYCSTAEIYDPVFDGWSVTGSMSVPRAGHSATMLADGRVLVTGGFWAPVPPPIYWSTAEIFNPGTGTWVSTARSA